MKQIMEDMHIHLKQGVSDYSIMTNYINRCKSLNLKQVLFLDHGNRISVKHIPVLINKEIVNKFSLLIDKLRIDVPDIKIYKGIEVDFSFDKEFQKREIELMTNFDYVIGSIHSMKTLGLPTRKEYYEAVLEMLDVYPIDILGHLKLEDNYLHYKDLIESIIKKCSLKNVIIEINTSDRSLWTIDQMQFMSLLIKKYKVRVTIGSDAHKIDELGHNYEIVSNMINEVNIEYEL